MKRVGIKDVAREAGVSTSTVSLVLSGKTEARIPAGTRERVHRVAAEIGYAPNSIARGLRTRRTHTIGLVSDQIATTPHAVRMIEAVQDVAREQGRLLFLVNTGSDTEVAQTAVETLLAHQVDGLVYACMWHQVVDPPAGLPEGTVFLDARPSSGGFPAVVPDDHGGAVAAVRELVAQGHRRIAYLAADEHPMPIASGLRWEGYEEVLRDAGIEPDPRLCVRVTTTTAGGGVEAAGAPARPAPGRAPDGVVLLQRPRGDGGLPRGATAGAGDPHGPVGDRLRRPGAHRRGAGPAPHDGRPAPLRDGALGDGGPAGPPRTPGRGRRGGAHAVPARPPGIGCPAADRL